MQNLKEEAKRNAETGIIVLPEVQAKELQNCFANLKCTNKKCVRIHDTIDGKSPGCPKPKKNKKEGNALGHMTNAQCNQEIEELKESYQNIHQTSNKLPSLMNQISLGNNQEEEKSINAYEQISNHLAQIQQQMSPATPSQGLQYYTPSSLEMIDFLQPQVYNPNNELQVTIGFIQEETFSEVQVFEPDCQELSTDFEPQERFLQKELEEEKILLKVQRGDKMQQEQEIITDTFTISNKELEDEGLSIKLALNYIKQQNPEIFIKFVEETKNSTNFYTCTIQSTSNEADKLTTQIKLCEKGSAFHLGLTRTQKLDQILQICKQQIKLVPFQVQVNQYKNQKQQMIKLVALSCFLGQLQQLWKDITKAIDDKTNIIDLLKTYTFDNEERYLMFKYYSEYKILLQEILNKNKIQSLLEYNAGVKNSICANLTGREQKIVLKELGILRQQLIRNQIQVASYLDLFERDQDVKQNLEQKYQVILLSELKQDKERFKTVIKEHHQKLFYPDGRFMYQVLIYGKKHKNNLCIQELQGLLAQYQSQKIPLALNKNTSKAIQKNEDYIQQIKSTFGVKLNYNNTMLEIQGLNTQNQFGQVIKLLYEFKQEDQKSKKASREVDLQSGPYRESIEKELKERMKQQIKEVEGKYGVQITIKEQPIKITRKE